MSAEREHLRLLLGQLLNAQITRVSLDIAGSVWILIDAWQVHIEGDWQLRGKDGEILDRSREISERTCFKLWEALGGSITRVSLSEDTLPQLAFGLDEGLTLELQANSDGLEDWSVSGQDWKIFCDGSRLALFQPKP